MKKQMKKMIWFCLFFTLAFVIGKIDFVVAAVLPEPQGITVKAESASRVKIGWKLDKKEKPFYAVYRKTDNASYKLLNIVPYNEEDDDPGYMDSTVLPGKNYIYMVRAIPQNKVVEVLSEKKEEGYYTRDVTIEWDQYTKQKVSRYLIKLRVGDRSGIEIVGAGKTKDFF